VRDREKEDLIVHAYGEPPLKEDWRKYEVCFVGEQPGGPPGNSSAFDGGSSTEKLIHLMNCSLEYFKAHYERVNLCPVSGPAYDKGFAQMMAQSLMARAAPTAYLLCGRKVAEAFGVSGPWFRTKKVADHVLVPIPHPSGRCRWWNDPENVVVAQLELSKFRR
jgi:hypothetical protein